jgi:lysozyme
MRKLLVRLLERDEEVRLDPYRDHLGFWTIGVGHLIDRRRGGGFPSWVQCSFPLTRPEVDQLLLWDIGEKEALLRGAYRDYERLDDVRKVVLLSMAFQLGVPGLMKFKETLRAVSEGRWGDAANGMRNSLWWRQTTARAERLAVAMLTGDEKAFKLEGGEP